MNNYDKTLETIVIVGFFLFGFALLFFTVPDVNKEHFGQVLGALTVIVTLVAKSMWERNNGKGKE